MPADTIAQRVYRRFAAPALALVSVNLIGMVGYKIIGGAQVSWLDSLYMTFITVATIGYGEHDLSHSPGGRVHHLHRADRHRQDPYLITATAFILEGDMNQAIRRRRMQKHRGTAAALHHRRHRVGTNVAHELRSPASYVVVEATRARSNAI